MFSFVQEYFNVMLGSQLLYKFEREQHADILKATPEVPMCKVRGLSLPAVKARQKLVFGFVTLKNMEESCLAGPN